MGGGTRVSLRSAAGRTAASKERRATENTGSERKRRDGDGGGGGTSLPAAPFRPTPEALSLPPGGGTSLPPDAGGALAGAGAGAWAGGGGGACMGRGAGRDQNRCRFGRARRPDESRNACWTPAPVCVQYVCIRAHEFKSRAQYLAQVAPGSMHPKLNV
jgi:hypothetical protein